jgi:signal peptidase II
MNARVAAADRTRWLVTTSLVLLVLILDQATKIWAVATLGPQPYTRTIVLGPEWLRLIYTQNTGVAFSLFQGMPLFFTVTSIVITLGLIYAYAAYLPNRQRWVQIAMGLLLGGAIGNIVDRLRLGYVVDFIAVGWWPVFNIADSAITVGVTMLAGYLIFVGDVPQPTPRTPPRDDGLLRDLLSRDVD